MVVSLMVKTKKLIVHCEILVEDCNCEKAI